MKKNILFLICLFFLHLSCKRSNQEIKLDDYEIIKIAIKEEVTPSISPAAQSLPTLSNNKK